MWCCHVFKRFKNINHDDIDHVIDPSENLTYLSSQLSHINKIPFWSVNYINIVKLQYSKLQYSNIIY